MAVERGRDPLKELGCATAVLDAIGALVVVLDRDGHIVYANRTCLELTGYGIDEVRGQAWDRFVIPDEVDETRDMIRSLAAEWIPATHENHWVRRCGAPRLISWRNAALTDVHGTAKFVIATGTDVTEKRGDAFALSDLDERFRELVENTTDVFFVRDLGKKREFYVSPSYEAVWGRSAQALREDPEDFINGIHPDDRDRVIAAYRRQTVDFLFNEEYRVVRPDGGLRWIHARAFPLFNENGEFSRVAGIAEDITERKLFQQALHDSEARLRQIIDLVPHLIFAKDGEGRYVLVNKAVADAYGTTVEQLTGRNRREMRAGQTSAEQQLADDREVMISGQPKRIAEESFVDAAGNERILETVKVPFVVPGDNRPAVLGVAIDITERRRMAKAIAEEAERYRLVVDTIAEAVVLIGADGRFRAGNASAARMVGVDPANLVGRSFFPQHGLRRIDEHGNHFPLEKHPIAVTLRTGEPFSNVVMGLVRNDDTVRWVSINTRPTFCNDNPLPDAVVVSLTDITAQKEAEAALAIANERLHQAVRVSEIGIFEHDHRNDVMYFSPQLRKIRGFSPDETLNFPQTLAQVPEEDASMLTESIKRAHDPAGDGKWDFEYRIVRKGDGAVRWLRSRTQTFFEGTGAARRPTKTIGAIVDITEQKESEALRMRDAIEHREALIREVHHRIKNNLQGVIGLLRQETIGSTELEMAMDRAIHRLRSVALIHGLEGRTTGRGVFLCELLREIVQSMSKLTLVPVILTMEIADELKIKLASSEAVAIALVINELLMNAIKHREPGDEPCEIRLAAVSGQVSVAVVNPGRLPAEFNFENGSGVGTGLRLVTSLLPRSGARLTLITLNKRVRAELNILPPIVSIGENDTMDVTVAAQSQGSQTGM